MALLLESAPICEKGRRFGLPGIYACLSLLIHSWRKRICFVLLIFIPLSVAPQQSDDHSCDSSKCKHQDENPKRKRTARLNVDQVLQRIHRQRITDGSVASCSEKSIRKDSTDLPDAVSRMQT